MRVADVHTDNGDSCNVELGYYVIEGIEKNVSL